jgi:hypothetical protein
VNFEPEERFINLERRQALRKGNQRMTQNKINFREHLKLDIGVLKTDVKSLCDDMQAAHKNPVLKVYIDATHSGRLTNLRVYPGKHMKAAADHFIKPSGKPVLKHHMDESEPIGRVFSAEYVQLIHGPAFEKDYLSPSKNEGSGYIKLGVNIMDVDAIQKILDGRYKNVSTRQSSDLFSCSICGENMMERSACDHQPGVKYNLGKDSDNDEYLCYGITGPLSYREVSIVNIPGDEFAEIKAMSFEQKDAMNFDSYDPHASKVKTLILSDGENDVDLLVGTKSTVTAKDRKKLTGKTIIAVSPLFDASKYEETFQEDSSMTKVEDKSEIKNTSASAASAGSGDPAQATSVKDSKEGVVAPENASKNTSNVGDSGGLSEKDSLAVVKSLNKSLEAAEAQAAEAKAESARFQTALKDKEAEVETLRKQTANQLADLKTAYAKMLLNTQIVLKKSTSASVKDAESYNKKLAEYAERSIDSLRDSVADLSIEMVELKDFTVIKTVKDLVSDKRVESPAANTQAVATNTVADVSKDKALETFFQ